MTLFGKLIFGFGLVLMVLGGLFWLLGRSGFRGLPGDIRYESDNVKIYFPIVTCLLLSAMLTLGMWLWQWFSRR